MKNKTMETKTRGERKLSPTSARMTAHAAAVARARQWLDEPDLLAGDTFSRRVLLSHARNPKLFRVILGQYAAEYAAATGLHPRTSRRHLEMALKQEK